VGAHNGLLEYGKRTGKYKLTPAHQTLDYSTLKNQYENIHLPKIKIAITGSGRVAEGAVELLTFLKIKQVTLHEYENENFQEPVYIHLFGAALYQKKNDETYDRKDFHANPEQYKSLFNTIMMHTDILINGVYWDSKVPRLFELNEVTKKDWRMFTIADISCDEGGSVPITLATTTIEKPTFGYDIDKKIKCQPYQKNTIDVMAVDNLPNELPRDASAYFGEKLIEFIIPELQNNDSIMLDKATITKHGGLTSYFEYLTDYAFPLQEV
jgi:alanine dehydrogenase